MFHEDNSGQVSAELILLFAGVIIVVIIAITIYKNYLVDFTNEINDNEVNDLKNKIDTLNNLMGEG